MKKLLFALFVTILLGGCDADSITGPNGGNNVGGNTTDVLITRVSSLERQEFPWDTYRPLVEMFGFNHPSGIADVYSWNLAGEPKVIIQQGLNDMWELRIDKPTLDDRVICFRVVPNDHKNPSDPTAGTEKCFDFNIVTDSEIWVVRKRNALYRVANSTSTLIRDFPSRIDGISFLPNHEAYLVSTFDKLYKITPYGEILWEKDFDGLYAQPLNQNTLLYSKGVLDGTGLPLIQLFTRTIDFETGVLGSEVQKSRNECDRGAPAPCLQGMSISSRNSVVEGTKVFVTGSHSTETAGFSTRFWGVYDLDTEELLYFPGPDNSYSGGFNQESNEGTLFRGQSSWIVDLNTGATTPVTTPVMFAGFANKPWSYGDSRFMYGLLDKNPVIINRSQEVIKTLDVQLANVDDVWLERLGVN